MVQSDQKVSVHLMITIQKEVKKDFLITLYHWPVIGARDPAHCPLVTKYNPNFVTDTSPSPQQIHYATITWLSVNCSFLNGSANGHKLKSDNDTNIKAFKLILNKNASLMTFLMTEAV
jgi:hypothetical protein